VTVVGVAETITHAEAITTGELERAGTEGLRVRWDIGRPDLVQSRIDHMTELRDE